MKEQIKIFENAQFGRIRTSVSDSGEPLFCLADVCKALDLQQVSKLRQRLNSKGMHTIPLLTNGGTQRAYFITEPNLYRCIFQSREKEAEQFQDWVCGEVLPSIRKSGGYMVAKSDETPEQIMARALMVAKDTIDRQQAALAKAESENTSLKSQNEVLVSMNEDKSEHIRQLLPAANFARAVETSQHSILVFELARIINQNGVKIGQNRLFKWLRDEGYLCKKGEMYNQPTQKAMDRGLFEIKKTVITKPSGDSIVTTTTKVTGKGQIYFVNRFLHGVQRRKNADIQMNVEAKQEGGAA